MRSWHLPILCLFYRSNPICQLTGFLAIEACLLPSETWISPIIPPVRNFPPPRLSNSASCWWVKLWKLAMWLRISVWISCGHVSQCECVWVSGVRPAFKRSKQPLSGFPCCALSYLSRKAIGCMALWEWLDEDVCYIHGRLFGTTTSFAQIALLGTLFFCCWKTWYSVRHLN